MNKILINVQYPDSQGGLGATGYVDVTPPANSPPAGSQSQESARTATSSLPKASPASPTPSQFNIPPEAMTGVTGAQVVCTANSDGDYLIDVKLTKQKNFRIAVQVGSGSPTPDKYFRGPGSHFAIFDSGGVGVPGAEIVESSNGTDVVLRF